mgnify:CR=1 FL=1
MPRNPWAFTVDRAAQIAEQEAILRRLDAQTAAKLNPDARRRAYGAPRG